MDHIVLLQQNCVPEEQISSPNEKMLPLLLLLLWMVVVPWLMIAMEGIHWMIWGW